MKILEPFKSLIRRAKKNAPPYLPPIERIKEGTVVEVDDAFTCMKPYTRRTVRRDKDGLYIRCAEGHHYLEGQECEAGEHGLAFDHYVGIKPIRNAA